MKPTKKRTKKTAAETMQERLTQALEQIAASYAADVAFKRTAMVQMQAMLTDMVGAVLGRQVQ